MYVCVCAITINVNVVMNLKETRKEDMGVWERESTREKYNYNIIFKNPVFIHLESLYNCF